MRKKFVVKGLWYYESQILMFVFMWQQSNTYISQRTDGIRIGRFWVWYDTAWTTHGIAGIISHFFYRLFVNVDKVKRPLAKLNVIRINAKVIFRQWRNGTF